MTSRRDRSVHLDSPGFSWSVHIMERAGVPNVLDVFAFREYSHPLTVQAEFRCVVVTDLHTIAHNVKVDKIIIHFY